MKKCAHFRYLVCLFLISTQLACVFGIGKKCQSFIPQKYKFGNYPIHIEARKTTLQVGDTIFLKARISSQFYDSLSQQNVTVNDKVALFIKVSTIAQTSNSINVFKVDTTIYHVFDQYFTTRVLKGSKTNAYLFDSQLVNGFWELELQYIALKPGQYDLSASFNKIQLIAFSDDSCMLGDVDKFGAQVVLKAVNNQINQVYPTLTPSPTNLFGFIIAPK